MRTKKGETKIKRVVVEYEHPDGSVSTQEIGPPAGSELDLDHVQLYSALEVTGHKDGFATRKHSGYGSALIHLAWVPEGHSSHSPKAGPLAAALQAAKDGKAP